MLTGRRSHRGPISSLINGRSVAPSMGLRSSALAPQSASSCWPISDALPVYSSTGSPGRCRMACLDSASPVMPGMVWSVSSRSKSSSLEARRRAAARGSLLQHHLQPPAGQQAHHEVADDGLVFDQQHPALKRRGGRRCGRRGRRRRHRPCRVSWAAAGSSTRNDRSLAGRGHHLDVAAMVMHDPMHHRQAHAGAAADLLGREEGLEHALHHFLRHAAAVVGDLDPDPAGCRRAARCTKRSAPPPPSSPIRTRMVPCSWIASRALMHRLNSTCSSCTGSATTGGTAVVVAGHLGAIHRDRGRQVGTQQLQRLLRHRRRRQQPPFAAPRPRERQQLRHMLARPLAGQPRLAELARQHRVFARQRRAPAPCAM